MIFNITYDVSVNLAPATFKSAVASVAQFFQNLFSDPVTINITVGYGEVGGQSMPSGALGSNISFLNSYSYAQIKSAFAADSKGGDDATAVSTLPATSPAPGGGTYWVPRAEAKALGLIGASGNLDGNVGFSNTVAFDYDNSNGITAGQYDFFGVAAHEFSEIMGRILLTGRTIGSTANSYVPYDLFHYSAPGVRDFVGTTPGYFSLDGGNTNLDNFNTNPSGDFGDWAASAGNDSFLAFSNAGVLNAVTAPDLRAMDILGWNRSAPTAATFLTQGDFNSDGKSDFTWRDANAQMSMWSVDALGNFAVTNLGTVASSWTILTADHFVNAGTSQMLTRSDPDGTMTLWWVAGGALTGINLGQHWSNISFVDHGNFVPSGQSDILVRNNIDNHMYVWWVDQNSSTLQGMDLGPYWANIQYKGHGDFNSDGTLDMLVRNVTDNHMYVWWVGANNALQGADLGAHWGNIDLVATGQFTSNGGTNMLVRNNVDNHMYDWWIDHNTNTLQGMDLGPLLGQHSVPRLRQLHGRQQIRDAGAQCGRSSCLRVVDRPEQPHAAGRRSRSVRPELACAGNRRLQRRRLHRPAVAQHGGRSGGGGVQRDTAVATAVASSGDGHRRKRNAPAVAAPVLGPNKRNGRLRAR
jgi:hypothetical protein